MLEVCNITKVYKSFFKTKVACKNVSFEVREGEIASLLGLNGAGKSTILKIISGVQEATEGDVIIEGKSIRQHPIEARREIGVLYENAPLYGALTVEEYLRFSMNMRGIRTRETSWLLRDIFDAFELQDVKDKHIAELSKGYKQRVAFAATLSHSPRVLILDEPTSNLDVVQLKEFKKKILQLDKTRIVLISTHNIELAKDICTKHILINEGEVILQGDVDELKEKIEDKYREELSFRRKNSVGLYGKGYDERGGEPSFENIKELTRENILEVAFDLFAGVKKSEFYKN